MARDASKREFSVARAKALYERLSAVQRPKGLSNNEWAARAGVNTSFFTNLKNGSEPSVGNLRAVLEVVGASLPEFFLEEAKGKLIRLPTAEDLEKALREAIPGMPKRSDKRAEYLAEVVLEILALPEIAPTSHANAGHSAQVSATEASAVRAATK
jgi:transcriptional regulator with XRE-family HTH domain